MAFSLTDRLWITLGNSMCRALRKNMAWFERTWEDISSFLQCYPYAQTCKIPLNKKHGTCKYIYCKTLPLWSGLSAVLPKYPWVPLHTCPCSGLEIQKQTRSVGTGCGIPISGNIVSPSLKHGKIIWTEWASDAAN